MGGNHMVEVEQRALGIRPRLATYSPSSFSALYEPRQRRKARSAKMAANYSYRSSGIRVRGSIGPLVSTAHEAAFTKSRHRFRRVYVSISHLHCGVDCGFPLRGVFRSRYHQRKTPLEETGASGGCADCCRYCFRDRVVFLCNRLCNRGPYLRYRRRAASLVLQSSSPCVSIFSTQNVLPTV